jgi:outer membrane protein OmpA-like peptidoglycan-associated protein
MIERTYRYYGGVVEAQFELVNIDLPRGKSIGGQHKIILVPKFRIFEFKEITKEDFENNVVQIISEKHLTYTVPQGQKTQIDFVPKTQKNVMARQFDVAHLVFSNEANSGDIKSNSQSIDSNTSLWKDTFIEEKAVSDYRFSLQLTPFLVNNKDHKHGRLHAHAIIRTVDEIIVPDKVELPVQKRCDYIDQQSMNQCEEKVLEGVRFCSQHQNLITDRAPDGCFGDGLFGGLGGTKRLWDRFLSPLGLDYSNSQGCFRGRNLNPVGCFSNSVPLQSRFGCGLGSLLSLIALLWLLWSLLFGSSSGCNQAQSIVAPKTDTVYVEVFRELKDTLKIVKNIVDSTTTNNYEMVSLPNVQFFTDSDKLLPSSSKELQVLAEYLIKNDSLQATILGHTDNTGDSKSNMDLSQRRAEAVKKFLENIGVKGSNLVAKGKGDTEPKADNASKEGRLMNRRVEVKLQQTQTSTNNRTERIDTSAILKSRRR